MSFKELIGHKIEKVYQGIDDNNVLFEVSTGVYKYYLYETVAECCNSVYIQSINGVKNLINGTVNDVIEKDSYNIEEESGTRCYIFWTIVTDKGYCDIEIRNDYEYYEYYEYYGDIEFAGNQVETSKGFKELLEDF